LKLRFPVQVNGRWTVRSAGLGVPRPGVAYEQMPAVSDEERERIAAMLRSPVQPARCESMVSMFLEGMQGTDWTAQMVAGRKAVENHFGVTVQDLRLRDAWWSPMAAMLLLDARSFAQVYNNAIADYRERFGVRPANRPVPPLLAEPDRVELPLWLYDSARPRARAFVSEKGGECTLLAGTTAVATFSREAIERADDTIALIAETGWRLRPRALMTTLWSRLFLADLFLHGIGGAKYDRITDDIIERYFHLPPPDIACVTATLYLDPRCEAADATVGLERQLRDQTWNPQRQKEAPGSPEFGLLVERKRAAAARSEELARRRPSDHSARKANFEEIRRINRQMVSHNPQAIEAIERRLAESRIAGADGRALCDRTYFFALHRRADLARLMKALPDEDAFVPTSPHP
jgi:hypothetical protein